MKTELKSYSFSIFNDYAKKGVSAALKELLNGKKPIICCIGSDLVLGDSLGPLVGTILTRKKVDAYIYGTLSNPVTAKEAGYIGDYVASIHKYSPILVIDAALGKDDDVGLIKVSEGGLKPGLGVNKRFNRIGNVGIMGIVALKTAKSTALLRLTRLNLVYRFAELIAEAIENYFNEIKTAEDYTSFFNKNEQKFFCSFK